jgi:hypothetical protein
MITRIPGKIAPIRIINTPDRRNRYATNTAGPDKI